ncbi:MAG: 30S ribosomal protein S16 [Candidatus Neomarinimicrobiota bacterium]|nr:30S ribosomal protein S16 [Candidatus Neomarinimicrobiota bacterium]
MATKIRLKRIGRRNRPFYRLVVMDSRKRRDGAAIEELGWYNPIDADHSFDIKDERIIHWLQEGAIPTNAANKILRRAGIAHHWHLMKQGFDEATIEKEMKKWALNREEVLQARVEQKVEAKTKEEAKSKEIGEESVKTIEADAKAPEDVDPKQEPAETPQDEDDLRADDPSQDSLNIEAGNAESGADDAMETDDQTMENNGAEKGEDDDIESSIDENEDSEEE